MKSKDSPITINGFCTINVQGTGYEPATENHTHENVSGSVFYIIYYILYIIFIYLVKYKKEYINDQGSIGFSVFGNTRFFSTGYQPVLCTTTVH